MKKLKRIKLLLTISGAPKQYRSSIASWLNEINDQWIDKGVFLEFKIWEDMKHPASQELLGDLFNEEMGKSDILFAVIYKKIGLFTHDKFRLAHKNWKLGDKPHYIKVFFPKPHMIPGEEEFKVAEFRYEVTQHQKFHIIFDAFGRMHRLIIDQLEEVLETMQTRKSPGRILSTENLAANKLLTGISGYPPIALKHLTLHNIKCFDHVELSFLKNDSHRKWTLLVGDNGVGKTTILNCIALCSLGPELASKIVPLPQSMLRMGAENGYFESVFDVGKEITIRLNIEKGSRTFDIDGEDELARNFVEVRKRTDFEGFFTVGYGPVRNLLFTDEPFKIAQQDPVIDRLESLFDPTKLLIDPSSLYRFLSGDLSPFREMGAPKSLEEESINYIRELLDKLLPMISFLEPNGSGSLGTPFGKVPIAELSEGYKSMLSWLAHLIMHLLAAVKWIGNINDVNGIALIDEVDLHLHPSWQQKVIPLLRECFPNLQFIGCTHSPMTAGGANDGDIVLLERDRNEISVTQDIPSIKGWRADQILTGPLFALESSRDLDTQKKLNEYEYLLGRDKPSAKEKKRLKELEAALADKIPSSGETPEEREAFNLIERTMESFLNQKPPGEKERLLKEIKRQLKR
jgi:hypothetical protein